MFSRIFIRTRVNLCTAVQKRVFCWRSESRIQRVTCCLQGQNPTVLFLSGLARIAANGINSRPTNNPKPLCGFEKRVSSLLLLPLMIIFITASLSSCTTEHHGETVLRSERRKPPLSQTWEVPTSCGFWGCCSHCERDAWGLSVLMGDGDECKYQSPNPSFQECPPDWKQRFDLEKCTTFPPNAD